MAAAICGRAAGPRIDHGQSAGNADRRNSTPFSPSGISAKRSMANWLTAGARPVTGVLGRGGDVAG